MYNYLRQDHKFYWVFSPVRKVFTGRDILGQANAAHDEYKMPYISASRKNGVGRLSMSDFDQGSSKYVSIISIYRTSSMSNQLQTQLQKMRSFYIYISKMEKSN